MYSVDTIALKWRKKNTMPKNFIDLTQFNDVEVVMPGNHLATFTGIEKELKEEPVTKIKREYYNFYFTLEDGTEMYWSRANFSRTVTYQGRTFEVIESQSAMKKLAVATKTKKLSAMVGIPVYVVVNQQGFISDVIQYKEESEESDTGF